MVAEVFFVEGDSWTSSRLRWWCNIFRFQNDAHLDMCFNPVWHEIFVLFMDKFGSSLTPSLAQGKKEQEPRFITREGLDRLFRALFCSPEMSDESWVFLYSRGCGHESWACAETRGCDVFGAGYSVEWRDGEVRKVRKDVTHAEIVGSLDANNISQLTAEKGEIKKGMCVQVKLCCAAKELNGTVTRVPFEINDQSLSLIGLAMVFDRITKLHRAGIDVAAVLDVRIPKVLRHFSTPVVRARFERLSHERFLEGSSSLSIRQVMLLGLLILTLTLVYVDSCLREVRRRGRARP